MAGLRTHSLTGSGEAASSVVVVDTGNEPGGDSDVDVVTEGGSVPSDVVEDDSEVVVVVTVPREHDGTRSIRRRPPAMKARERLRCFRHG